MRDLQQWRTELGADENAIRTSLTLSIDAAECREDIRHALDNALREINRMHSDIQRMAEEVFDISRDELYYK